jgi:hypothetical protein
MDAWWNSLGLVMAMVSATALYVASPHCRWPFPRRWSRGARGAGLVLAGLSLAAWIFALGPAVGVCAMLATWMLAMVVLPYLALLTGSVDTRPGGDA